MKYLIAAAIIALPLAIIGQDQPLLIALAFVIIIIGLIVELKTFRRKVKLRIHTFEQSPRQPDLEFLQDVDINPVSEDAIVAIGVRHIIAKYAGIPDDCVSANLQFPEAFGILFDSLDVVDFIMEFEKKLEIRIPDKHVEKFCPFSGKGNGRTIRNYVLEILDFYKESIKEKLV